MHNLPDIAFFHTLADAAAEQTLPRYRSAQNLHIGNKPKEGFRFDPVTDADREAERAIRVLISAYWICPYISRRFFSLTVAITSCV